MDESNTEESRWQMSNQGEWTDRQLSDIYAHGGLRGVADAHNAALAAERNKYVSQREDWIREIQQLQKQLASDQPKPTTGASWYDEEMKQLRDQLAAEREKSHWLGELLAVIHCDGGHYLSEHGTKKATEDAIMKRNAMVMRIDELETQLSAERDKHQPLVDGLHRLYALRDPKCHAQAERAYEMALAKGQEMGKG